MKTRKLLPIGFLALGLIGSGAMIATAQSAPNVADGNPAQVQEQVRRDNDRGGERRGGDHRGDEKRGGKGGHEGKRGGDRHGGVGMSGGGEMMRTLFATVDADGDGSVTQEEVDVYRASKVGEADVSGDGALSIEEFDTLYREFTRSRMVDIFQDFDADGDGVISSTELDSRFGNVVDRMDRDDDGALTLQDRGRRN